MKKALLTIALCVAVAGSAGAEALTVNVTEAGTLEATVGERIYQVDSLTVTGPVNDADMAFIAQAAKKDIDFIFAAPRRAAPADPYDYPLVYVNLAGAQIEGNRIKAKTFYIEPDFGHDFCAFRRIVLPEGLTEVEAEAFRDCRYMVYNLPSTLTTLGEKAFMNCAYIADGVVPAGIVSIPYAALASKDGDAVDVTLTLPEGLKTIAAGAFTYSPYKAVSLPSTLESIGEGAFERMKGSIIYCRAAVPPVCADNAFRFVTDCTCYVPVGTKSLYMEAVGWKTLPKFEEMDFSGIQSIVTDNAKSIVLTPAGVKIAECREITDLSLPAGVYIIVRGTKVMKVKI